MPLYFLGESVVTLGKRSYTLRPSFAALHAIEQHCRAALPQVIMHMDSQQCHAEIVRFVLHQGITASGNMPLPRLCSRQWLALRETAITFLIQGLGYRLDEKPPETYPPPTQDAPQLPAGRKGDAIEIAQKPSGSHSPFEPLNWPQLYKTATGLLGKSETEFWQMTLCGLLLQCEAYAAAQGIEIAQIGHPATLDDLHSMMQQFPDTVGAA